MKLVAPPQNFRPLLAIPILLRFRENGPFGRARLPRRGESWKGVLSTLFCLLAAAERRLARKGPGGGRAEELRKLRARLAIIQEALEHTRRPRR